MEKNNSHIEIQPSDLPCPNPQILQVLKVCSQVDSSPSDIADLVIQDPLLTAEFLRIVNTPFFGLATGVKSVTHALSILGMKAVRNLVICLAVSEILSVKEIDGFDHKLFREDALRRAIIARMLAPHFNIDTDEAFTLGILQDIGLLALFYLYPATASRWKELRQAKPDSRLQLEQEIFSTRHDLVAHILLEQWYLPSDLCLAIGYHHRLEELEDGPVSDLAHILFFADWLTSFFTSNNSGIVLAQCRELMDKHTNIDQHELDSLLRQTQGYMIQAGIIMGMTISGDKDDYDQIMKEANLQMAKSSIGFQELSWQLKKTIKERDILAEELNRELEMARDIQRSLLPDSDKEDKVRAFNISAKPLTGDFYDYFRDTKGHLWFCVGDVTGKGAKAAILMAKTIGLFRCLARNGCSPRSLIVRLNMELLDTYIMGMFVSIVVGKLDTTTGSLELINAGHPPAFIIHGNDISILQGKSPPLGIKGTMEYHSVKLLLSKAVLYVYSDGVIESLDEDGNVLDIEGFLSILKKVHALPLAERMINLENHFNKQKGQQQDDITLLAIEH